MTYPIGMPARVTWFDDRTAGINWHPLMDRTLNLVGTVEEYHRSLIRIDFGDKVQPHMDWAFYYPIANVFPAHDLFRYLFP